MKLFNLLSCFTIALLFLSGCTASQLALKRYEAPSYVDVKDKNECSERAWRIYTRVYNNSTNGKSTYITDADFAFIDIDGVAVFLSTPIRVHPSSSAHKDGTNAHKEYMKTCLRKKGYELDN